MSSSSSSSSSDNGANLLDYGLPVKVPERLVQHKAQAISQGAEALVFIIPGENKIAKYRTPKAWRLPELDRKLRKLRMNQESRVLRKLKAAGVAVPEVSYMDIKQGLMYMDLIPGKTLKEVTWEHQTESGEVTPEMRTLYEQLGSSIARMHGIDIVHGDLTTSNAIVTPENEVVLIDFGLASQNGIDEDKAVDLYVLERALQSTHPREAKSLMMDVFMPSYIATAKTLPGRDVDLVLGKLEKVRRRGRKRTQIG